MNQTETKVTSKETTRIDAHKLRDRRGRTMWIFFDSATGRIQNTAPAREKILARYVDASARKVVLVTQSRN